MAHNALIGPRPECVPGCKGAPLCRRIAFLIWEGSSLNLLLRARLRPQPLRHTVLFSLLALAEYYRTDACINSEGMRRYDRDARDFWICWCASRVSASTSSACKPAVQREIIRRVQQGAVE